MVVNALKTYGYEPDPHVVEAFTKYRKTHNDAVFDAYTADVRQCRSSHILTGLPDAYGRQNACETANKRPAANAFVRVTGLSADRVQTRSMV